MQRKLIPIGVELASLAGFVKSLSEHSEIVEADWRGSELPNRPELDKKVH
jgi:hypothetical protein